MKVNRNIALAFAIVLGIGSVSAQEDFAKAQNAPQSKETVLVKVTRTRNGYDNPQSAYKAALREAKQANPKKEVGIRNLTKGNVKVNGDGSVSYYYTYSVVELPSIESQKMYVAIGRATREIEEGNCFALDKINVINDNIDKEKMKGQIIDYLIGRGFKVVAKEYLEKLFKEQKDQQSGIYKEESRTEMGNFSAAGYFINVRITEEYVQAQVINVTTGEFVGNVIENL